eukprot:GILK01003726.1.p1 GENE.GILK01003726.1~~GILK01003726.1.p1  ORF type:complete len:245 (-),score=63.11 GILK01003726.1:217-864(-)
MQDRLKKKRQAREQKEKEKRQKDLQTWKDEQAALTQAKIEEVERETDEMLKSEAIVRTAHMSIMAKDMRRKHELKHSDSLRDASSSTKPSIVTAKPAPLVHRPSARKQPDVGAVAGPSQAAAGVNVSYSSLPEMTQGDVTVLNAKLSKVETLLTNVHNSQYKTLLDMFQNLSSLITQLKSDLDEADIESPQATQQMDKLIHQLKQNLVKANSNRK